MKKVSTHKDKFAGLEDRFETLESINRQGGALFIEFALERACGDIFCNYQKISCYSVNNC
jgi:hypothetical protein